MENVNQNILNNYIVQLIDWGVDPNVANAIYQENIDSIRYGHLLFIHNLFHPHVNNANLPVAPFELHPYLEISVNYCERERLLIGTFPPISYMGDKLFEAGYEGLLGTIRRPKLNFFHGNRLILWKNIADEELTNALEIFNDEINVLDFNENNPVIHQSRQNLMNAIDNFLLRKKLLS